MNDAAMANAAQMKQDGAIEVARIKEEKASRF